MIMTTTKVGVKKFLREFLEANFFAPNSDSLSECDVGHVMLYLKNATRSETIKWVKNTFGFEPLHKDLQQLIRKQDDLLKKRTVNEIFKKQVTDLYCQPYLQKYPSDKSESVIAEASTSTAEYCPTSTSSSTPPKWESLHVGSSSLTKTALQGTQDILIVEPFYCGSHRQLVDCLMGDADIGPRASLFTMPGKKWHWRARTAALHFSTIIPRDHKFRTLFSSSVLNLAELVALRPDLASLHKVLYFHENQLQYPVRNHKDRDFQYGYNQIISCLVADQVLFNSKFNMDSFLDSINSFMKLMPDHRPKGLANLILPKCSVLYFPLLLPPIDVPASAQMNVPSETNCNNLSSPDTSEDLETAGHFLSLHQSITMSNSGKGDYDEEVQETNSKETEHVSMCTDECPPLDVLASTQMNVPSETKCNSQSSLNTSTAQHPLSLQQSITISYTDKEDCDKEVTETELEIMHTNESPLLAVPVSTQMNVPSETNCTNQTSPNTSAAIETAQHPLSLQQNITISNSDKGDYDEEVQEIKSKETENESMHTDESLDESSRYSQVFSGNAQQNDQSSLNTVHPVPSGLKETGMVHIVWPHRWEHDKDPETFFQVLYRLHDEGLRFMVSVLGETFSDIPDIFPAARQKLESHIVAWGFQESKNDYFSILRSADVVVSTSKHEFFGVAMLEAVHFGCYPLCPKSLVYPEIYPDQCLYATETQLYKRLRSFCRHQHLVKSSTLQINIEKFSWKNLREQYIRNLLKFTQQ